MARGKKSRKVKKANATDAQPQGAIPTLASTPHVRYVGVKINECQHPYAPPGRAPPEYRPEDYYVQPESVVRQYEAMDDCEKIVKAISSIQTILQNHAKRIERLWEERTANIIARKQQPKYDIEQSLAYLDRSFRIRQMSLKFYYAMIDIVWMLKDETPAVDGTVLDGMQTFLDNLLQSALQTKELILEEGERIHAGADGSTTLGELAKKRMDQAFNSVEKIEAISAKGQDVSYPGWTSEEAFNGNWQRLTHCAKEACRKHAVMLFFGVRV